MCVLHLKHNQWVQDELDMVEKPVIISGSTALWSSPIVILPKKLSPERYLKNDCVDYNALNSLLPTVVKAYSEVQRVLSLVPLPKTDEHVAMLN